MGRDKRSKAALHRNHSSAVVQWERRQKISLKPRNHMATHFYSKKRKRRDFCSLKNHDCKQKKIVQFRDFTDANTNCGFHASPPPTRRISSLLFPPSFIFCSFVICQSEAGTSSQTQSSQKKSNAIQHVRRDTAIRFYADDTACHICSKTITHHWWGIFCFANNNQL